MWIQCTRDSAPIDYGTYPLGGGNDIFFFREDGESKLFSRSSLGCD